MLLRSALPNGSTHSFSCWECDGRLLAAECPFSGECTGLERVTLPNMLPLPASKDWLVQGTNVSPCSNAGQFCRAIPAPECATGLDEALWGLHGSLIDSSALSYFLHICTDVDPKSTPCNSLCASATFCEG